MNDNKIQFWVPGRPAPQGSKTGFVNPKTGKVIMTPASKYTKPWREAVKWIALEKYSNMEVWQGPMQLEIVFYQVRPKGHFGTGRNKGKLKTSARLYPTVSPNLTKLIRSTEDALTNIIYQDDKQIVKTIASKEYSDKSGALITITRM